MKKPGMSTHSIESFNESEAVVFLSSILESKHKIKTFFSANDKTPNHDGFFELVDGKQTPKKQFIVQIKKVENLTPNVQGKNKDKYVYELKTNFLYYVKAKVTESPAIYFIVDIAMKRIFWLYLSDEMLMSLNFEGYDKISYAFSNDEILCDIDLFTQKLDRIATERNAVFLQKTPQEIAEMQDAVDYINQLLDHDLSVIKENMFPQLWRFGIKCSNTSALSIGVNGNMVTPPVSSLLALYPQIKGVPDAGIREYYYDKSNLFDYIVFGKKGEALEYSKDSLHKILESFFENGLPIKYLPDIVLKELISVFIEESSPLFEDAPCSEPVTVDEIERRFVLLAQYTQHLILQPCKNKSEQQLKEGLISCYNRGERNYYNMASSCLTSGSKKSFREFCQNMPTITGTFSPELFDIMHRKYIQYFCMIGELRERSILNINPVWNYNWIELRQLPKDEFGKAIDYIFSYWFSELPSLYEQTYSKLFDHSKFHFNGRYVYRNSCSRHGQELASIISVVHHYFASTFEIYNDNEIASDFTPELEKKGLLNIHSGYLFDEFLDGKTLFFDAISCLLYQGICAKLEFKPQPLHLRSNRFNHGLILF